MQLETTIAKIRELCPSFQGRVFGASSFSLITPEALKALKPETLPVCYVMTVNETPKEEQRSENSYIQEIIATVGVVIISSSIKSTSKGPSLDVRGQNAMEEIERLKLEIFKAILSWSPTDDPFSYYSYSNYDLLQVKNGLVIVELDFESSYSIDESQTRQPDELEEQMGRLNQVDMDVDVIRDDIHSPDGKIEAKARFKDLW